MKTKAILYLAGLVFIIFFILFLFGLALSQDFFFQNWERKSVSIKTNGLLQITLTNPDSTEEIKSVMVLAMPDGVVISYCFLRKGLPEIWVSDQGGGYLRSPEQEKGCAKCHNGQQVRL